MGLALHGSGFKLELSRQNGQCISRQHQEEVEEHIVVDPGDLCSPNQPRPVSRSHLVPLCGLEPSRRTARRQQCADLGWEGWASSVWGMVVSSVRGRGDDVHTCSGAAL